MRSAPPKDPYWLVRYVLVSAGEGVAAGWTFLLVLVEANLTGLRPLVHDSADGPLAFLALLVAFAITFGVVGIGLRVMFDLPRYLDRDE